jgi:hypothetical protein
MFPAHTERPDERGENKKKNKREMKGGNVLLHFLFYFGFNELLGVSDCRLRIMHKASKALQFKAVPARRPRSSCAREHVFDSTSIAAQRVR